ncbi:MAG: ATP-dependent RNA helicase HrpA [Actinophytocola sp.]|nr:ATP-dependent RNA helicase HrpA [Actinophytocola sp.]
MSTAPSAESVAPRALLRRLDDVMLADRVRLRRRIDGTRKLRDERKRASVLRAIAADVDAAELRLAGRRESVPAVRYPAELPVSQRAEDIANAIRDNQVVIVAGETGSGKTTQLPKICLDIGRGVHGTIGHTQPRRIVARSVAERIASELGTDLGDTVGWKIRFTDQVSENTLVKVMTDGILLAEIGKDRLLRQYDTLIIDEAHERSLNIDFLLGYLKQLLPRRPDLKVIITSATIDPERFAAHFGHAPVVEVSGRTYPVEVRYRPITDPDTPDAPGDKDRDQLQAICDAVTELRAEPPGDILIFLSGEREIRDTADALTAMDLPGTEILPLYARLSAAEQHRVFQRHTGRRIVLATNVAETSLTVPGIKYVIDPGTARISRYSNRLKVQRLPIEPISQASANQRKGRCGRVSDGVCIRLYSEDDFLARPEFTDPEILRTNLASVILQLTAADLGDIADFPFVEPPDKRQIADGLALLRELGALETSDGGKQHSAHRLTDVGRMLAQLPVDPRMARMIVAAGENGCAHEVLVIAAALSIQDPRERPDEQRQAADTKHARFADPNSDFLAFLSLWDYLREQQRALSGNRFRRLCKAEFLHFLRVREWQDLYNQLKEAAKSAGISVAKPKGDVDFSGTDYARLHESLLAGMLSHIGLKDPEKRDFLGARGARFAVFPGSALFKKTPPRGAGPRRGGREGHWVMAAELVETSRLWGRIVARIEPEWVERLAGHLLKRSYAEPHWERNRGAVIALETVTLYGVPLASGRKVNYARVEPELCRELFIRHALVEGDWRTDHRFFHANRELLDEVTELENRARRRDILVDDQTLFDFYDERIPDHVVSARHFDSWWKKAWREQPGLLDFWLPMLVNESAAEVSDAEYPQTWRHGDIDLTLTYQFEPGASDGDADGVTVHVPLAVLNQVSTDGFDWQVPGFREELVTALLKSLPKPLRRELVPAPDTAKAVLDRLDPDAEPLLAALERELSALRGVDVRPDDWDLAKVPDHLRMTFRIVDERGRRVAEGKDLDALRQQQAPQLRSQLSRAAEKLERQGVRDWDFDSLPTSFEGRSGGKQVKGYPALVDTGDAVDVTVLATEHEQREAMWHGTRRLVLLRVGSPRKALRRTLSNTAKLELAQNPHGGVSGLLDDCVACALDVVIAEAGGPAWDAEGFERLVDAARAGLDRTVVETMERVRRVLVAWRSAQLAVKRTDGPGFGDALADVSAQLDELVYDGFVTATGFERLPDLARYLTAIERRLEKLPRDLERDTQRMRTVLALTDEHRTLLVDAPAEDEAARQGLTEIRWMLEELRVSLFAQTLGTAYPVSEKRVQRALDAVR